jgi:hypothetical protein
VDLIPSAYGTSSSYDYETYAPPSTNGNGGLGFIGMQRCLDCSSSPIDQLKARQAAQGWASKYLQLEDLLLVPSTYCTDLP